MQTLTIGKWGNSTAVRLPKSILVKFNLQEGDTLRLVPTDSPHLVLEPVRSKNTKRVRGRYRLNELMPTDANVEKLDEWDEMPAVGQEIEL